MDKEGFNYLKEIIVDEVFVTRKQATISNEDGTAPDWIFEFRKVLMRAKVLNIISEIFLDRFKEMKEYQIGGLEVAAIPLVSGFIMKAFEKGLTKNGFFIRKSRKKNGLTKMIEGDITEDPIVLVDDLMNRGTSFIRQIEVLEQLGKKVVAVFTILRYRDIEYYTYLNERGIKIISLFTLDDFSDQIPVSNLIDVSKKQVSMPFKIQWCFKSENPSLHLVVPKSAPVTDETRVYFGADNGCFWALNQATGETEWCHKVLWFPPRKSILSAPALWNDTVYFGAYDGNVYALDTATGKKKWVCSETDWVGSSPSIAPDLKLLFIGEEFGLWKKRGGIVALDLVTGEKRWSYREIPGLVHSSPCYIPERQIVVIGSNSGSVYCFDAKKGKLLWTFKTDAEVKASFAYDKKRDHVCFGAFNGLYIVKAGSGELVSRLYVDHPFYSTPIIYGNTLISSSLDKNLYCIDLDTFTEVWKFSTGGRIFANPVVIEESLYIGSNDGRFYEIDPSTGKNIALMQLTERIVNPPAYNGKTKRFFLPTYANEMYCLERKDLSKD